MPKQQIGEEQFSVTIQSQTKLYLSILTYAVLEKTITVDSTFALKELKGKTDHLIFHYSIPNL